MFCVMSIVYVVAYFVHCLPIECPSAARMDNKTVLITGKLVCSVQVNLALYVGVLVQQLAIWPGF